MEMFEYGEKAQQGKCPHCGCSPEIERRPRFDPEW